jgi:hypothetical protein
MTTDKSVHHSHLASTSNQQAIGMRIVSPLDFLSEAADLVHRRKWPDFEFDTMLTRAENGPHIEGFRVVTPHNFQTTVASLPQQRDFGTGKDQITGLLIIAK